MLTCVEALEKVQKDNQARLRSVLCFRLLGCDVFYCCLVVHGLWLLHRARFA